MANGFSITIGARDKASPILNAVNRSMQAFTRPARELQATFARFSTAAGIPAITRNVEALRSSAFAATESLTKIVTPLGAITGAASIAGLYKLTTAWAAWGQQLEFSAQRIGIGADQLQQFQGVARLAGSSAGAMTASLTSLEDTMVDAIGGRNGVAMNWLTALQINFRKTATTVRSAADVFPQIRQRLHAITNPALQAKAATILLGGAAEDLLPVIRMSNEEYAQYVKWTRQYGVVNGQAVIAARQLSVAQTRVELATEGLTNSIAASLAPVLTPMLGSLADWIGANRQIIAGGLAEYVKRFAGWLEGINWKGVEQGFDGTIHRAEHFVHLLDRIASNRAFRLLDTIGGQVLDGGRSTNRLEPTKVKGFLSDGTGFAVPTAADAIMQRLTRSGSLVRGPGDPKIEAAIRVEAIRQGADPDRMVALARTESGARQVDPNTGRVVTSPTGAVGAFQLEPGTAKDLGVNPNDTTENIRGGIQYYQRLLRAYHGNADEATAAYNMGPGSLRFQLYRLTQDRNVLPNETIGEIAKVDATEASLHRVPTIDEAGAEVRPRPVSYIDQGEGPRAADSASSSGEDGSYRDLLQALREGNKQAVSVHIQHDNPPPGSKIRVAKAAPNVGTAMMADNSHGY